MVCGGGREKERVRYTGFFLGGGADGKHNNGESKKNEEDEKQGATTESLRLE